MPDIVRWPARFNCEIGLDLVHPIDKMPAGAYPIINNARITQEGRIDGRPGYTLYGGVVTGAPPNSVRQLNDPSLLYAPSGGIIVGGEGSNLRAGSPSLWPIVDTGYSSFPLSLIPFRPQNSPESWMYVYDRAKSVKVRPDGVVRSIGIAPPVTAPTAEYGPPVNVDVHTGQSATGFTATGIDGSITTADRTAGAAATVAFVIYVTANIGWCFIRPSNGPASNAWSGGRMKVILNAGQPNAETVLVREVKPNINPTTIQAIKYDSGNTGWASVILASNDPGLTRNALLEFNPGGGTQEVVRVSEIIYSPDGSTYCIRVNLQFNHIATENITSLTSWYCYTTKTHAGGETITMSYVSVTHGSAGVGGARYTFPAAVDASNAGNRAVSTADDYMHISLFFSDPTNIVTFQIMLSLDNVLDFANPGNAYIWTLTKNEIGNSGANSWVEFNLPISQAQRTGSDFSITLADVAAIAFQMDTTANNACNWGFDWFYLFGTYGPTILPNSPVGITYQYRYRDSSTGAYSVPGPQTRFEIFPLRESVIITPAVSPNPAVDTVDMYRDGGNVTSPLYIGSAQANGSWVIDTLSDATVLEINQPPDLSSLQPWPIQQVPWAGTVNVVGTTVTWLTGNTFNPALLSNTALTINGVTYLTFGQPNGLANQLQLTQNAGNQPGVAFEISSPTLAGQTLLYSFGPLEGPFAPVIFALGDLINGGLLYFCNFNNPDGASDANTLELSTPSQPLISGAVWNGLVFAGSMDDLYVARYSYLTTIGASNNASFQWSRIEKAPGIWSRWACCSTPVGVAYLGRDGIYLATDTQFQNITDATLYPLFPHDGNPATPVTPVVGGLTYYPVDMTQITNLRLSYCDQELRFCYKDTNGGYNTLVFDLSKKRWMFWNYAGGINYHYQFEYGRGRTTDASQTDMILGLDEIGRVIVEMGGNTDNGTPIPTTVLPAMQDGGDERTGKLFVDMFMLAGGPVGSSINMVPVYGNGVVFGTSRKASITGVGEILIALINLNDIGTLETHRNISPYLTWVGGPDGPVIYQWEPSLFLQPYLSSRFVTQISSMSFPGWKHMRRIFPAIISTFSVALTIKTQDGRVYGPFQIASTKGQFKILPQMLPHGLKDLAFALQLDGEGQSFVLFPQDFTVEIKEWNEEQYIKLALFRA